MIYEVPDSMKDEDAAGFIIPVHTAYHAVHRRGQVQSSETVLVLGAAGGVPSSAVQLCAAAGCRVIAMAGGSEKVAFAKELGANVVINHRQSPETELSRTTSRLWADRLGVALGTRLVARIARLATAPLLVLALQLVLPPLTTLLRAIDSHEGA